MIKDKIIPIGADHAGFPLKQSIIEYFTEQGYKFKDFGTYSEDSIDYPDYGHPVAKHIQEKGGLGIAICGSGNGINMTVNKHEGIRGALCWNEKIAALARQHNNANILVMPGRFVSIQEGIKITETFFNTEFEGGRHQRRIDKINC
ncbi:MAG: ribose 5-phosphate isomerase B [Brumimicrobium sp.]